MPIRVIGQGPVPGLPYDAEKVKAYDCKEAGWTKFIRMFPMGVEAFKWNLVTDEPEEFYKYYQAYKVCETYTRLYCEYNNKPYFANLTAAMFKAHTTAFAKLAEFMRASALPCVAFIRSQFHTLKERTTPNQLYSNKAIDRWQRYERVELGKHVLSDAKARKKAEMGNIIPTEIAWHTKYQKGKSYYEHIKKMYPTETFDIDVMWIECLAIGAHYLVTRQDFMDTFAYGCHPTFDEEVKIALRLVPLSVKVYPPA